MSNTIHLTANVRGFIPNPNGRRPAASDPEDARRRAMERACGVAADAARQQMEKELAAAQAAQRQQCRNCGDQFDAFLHGLKKETGQRVIDLALSLAEVIVRHQLPDADMLRKILEETLEPVGDLQGARVRLNGADAQALRSAAARSMPLLVSGAVEIVEDPALAPGDLLIESRHGCFDGCLNQRLETLKKRLRERYGNGDATQSNV